MATLAICKKKRRWWGFVCLLSAFLRLGKEARAAPGREQLERLLGGQSSQDSHAVMNCACPCASCKIYICATEWQCLGAAALSVWLHWCFDIPGTFKIPLNATHRYQRALRKDIEGQSRVGRAEEPAWSSHPAWVLGAEHPIGIRLPSRQMGLSRVPQAHLFSSML